MTTSENEPATPVEPAAVEPAELVDPGSGELTDEEMTAELELLSRQNKTRLMALVNQGVNVDPSSVLALRIDLLAELVLNEHGLLTYKLRTQCKLAESLRELSGQVNKARIAAAAQASPQ